MQRLPSKPCRDPLALCLSLFIPHSSSSPHVSTLPLPLGACSSGDSPSHHSEIRRLFPRAQMQTVPNAGHWVHADCPQDFMAAIQGFLA